MPDAPIIVLYDDGCRWCRFSIARVLAFDRDGRLLPDTIQSAEGQRLLAGVPEAERLETAHAIGPDGVVHSGGDAAPVIADELPLLRWSAPVLRRFPGAVRAGYDLVAGNRHRLGPLVPRAQTPRDDAAIAAHRRRHLSH